MTCFHECAEQQHGGKHKRVECIAFRIGFVLLDGNHVCQMPVNTLKEPCCTKNQWCKDPHAQPLSPVDYIVAFFPIQVCGILLASPWNGRYTMEHKGRKLLHQSKHPDHDSKTPWHIYRDVNSHQFWQICGESLHHSVVSEVQWQHYGIILITGSSEISYLIMVNGWNAAQVACHCMVNRE